jgi:hypothetical protein
MTMNKILSVFFVILISNSLSAQDKNGKVYIMRSEGFQAPAAPFNLFIDQKIVGKLTNKRYSIHDVKPGNHVFSTQFAGKKPSEKAEKMDVQVEAGKTYYIQVNFQQGFFKNKLHFKEVKEDDAKKLLPGLKQIKS